jgi:hypothetical protein
MKFKQMTFRKANLVVGEWRDHVTPEDRQFADRSINLMSTPRFDELLDRSKWRPEPDRTQVSQGVEPVERKF